MEQAIDAKVKAVILQTFEAGSRGELHFADTVASLRDAGVESYQVDFRAQRTSYFLPCGASLTLDFPGGTVAETFDAPALQSAIRLAQAGSVMYPEFKRLALAAGVAAYTVWITGRHVSYYGRAGQTHVEYFPSA